jgi:predicted HicB family RNase H-like nuclease
MTQSGRNISYKGYLACIEFDDDAGVLRGEVINTRDVITFEGTSIDVLRQALADSVEDYLAFCAERGEEPDRPFSGKFSLRVDPELHRQITVKARLANKSVNSWIAETLEAAVGNR